MREYIKIHCPKLWDECERLGFEEMALWDDCADKIQESIGFRQVHSGEIRTEVLDEMEEFLTQQESRDCG